MRLNYILVLTVVLFQFNSRLHKVMVQETVDSDIGDERRRVPVTTEKPYSGIAHLIHENGKAIGTGFLVKHGGRTFLVTAAHCLWDRRERAFKANIHISLGRNGECHPFGTIKKKSVDFIVPREYKETEDPMYDYGIILLDKKEHELDKCCTFDLEPRTDEYIKSQDLYMSGYPRTPKEPKEQKDGVPGWPPGTQWEIKLTTVTVNKRKLQYRDATTPGNSGSPVYEMKDGRYVVHGIHTNGIDKKTTSNEAVWIDVDALMKLVRDAEMTTTPNGNLVPNNPQPTSVETLTVQTRPQDPPPQPNGNAPGYSPTIDDSSTLSGSILFQCDAEFVNSVWWKIDRYSAHLRVTTGNRNIDILMVHGRKQHGYISRKRHLKKVKIFCRFRCHHVRCGISIADCPM